MKHQKVYPQDEQDPHSPPGKTTTLFPHTQEQWTRTTSEWWASTETEKPVSRRSLSPSLTCQSIMFWMWMMASMIALELNSVTRIHNEYIRFLSLMVKCQLHIIIFTYNKSCIFTSLSAMRCTLLHHICTQLIVIHVLRIAQIMPEIARQSLVCITIPMCLPQFSQPKLCYTTFNM